MKTKKYASNLAIWQKLLLVLCAAMVNLLPASSAAAADDAWTILNRAVEIAGQKQQFCGRCEYRTFIQGPQESGISFLVTGDVVTKSNTATGSHTEGSATFTCKLPSIDKSFTYPINSYNLVKGNKVTMYNLQSDGSWQVEKFVAADDMVKKVQEVMGKSSAMLKKYADAVLVGEKDGLLEIKLLPRAEAGLPDLSGLTEDKGILEMQQSMRNYIAAPNAENVEIHLFINSATGELTYMQVDLSRWLKDELQLLNAMPELKAMAGLSQVDLSALDCGMIMNCEYVSLPKDYQVVVPAEIKKNARKLKK